MDTQKEMLVVTLLREKRKLDELEPGTEEYRKVATEFNEHYKLYIEHDKHCRDRKIGAITTAVSVGVPAATYIGLFLVGLKSESGGMVFTSSLFRGLLSKLKPGR